MRCGLTVLDGPFVLLKQLLREVTATERITFGWIITGILDVHALEPFSGLVVVDVVGENLAIGFAIVLQNAGSAALTCFLGEHWSGAGLSIGSTTC